MQQRSHDDKGTLIKDSAEFILKQKLPTAGITVLDNNRVIINGRTHTWDATINVDEFIRRSKAPVSSKEPKPYLPEWVKRLVHQYRTGNYHQFLIDGNIWDHDFMHLKGEGGYDKQFIGVKEILATALRDLGISRIISYSPTLDLQSTSITEDKNIIFSGSVDTKEIPLEGDFNSLLKPSDGESARTINILGSLYALEKALLTKWEKTGQRIRIATIIQYLDKIAPESSQSETVLNCREIIQRWGLNRRIRQLGHISVLFTENRAFLPHDLRNEQSGIYTVNIPLPDLEGRKRYFEYEKHQNRSPTSPLHKYLTEDDEHTTEIAYLTKGFRLVDCRMIADASALDNKYDILSLKENQKKGTREYFFVGENPDAQIDFYLSSQKNEVIRNASHGMLEPMAASLTFQDIGGLKGVKNYFKKVAEAITSESPEMKKAVPKGVLLEGPPGTGKTILARALSRETHLSLVRMGNIRSMWVGESERNLSMVLNLLKAMAPVIVFVDEIDQALGARSTSAGDSGVSGRIFQQILEFMGDNANRGDVIWIAATNRADLLDEAMISRFDRIMPVLLPGSKKEWKAVMEGIFRQLGIKGKNADLIDIFLDHPQKPDLTNHSGRSMETAIRFACQNMMLTGRSELNIDDLLNTFDRFKTNIDRSVYDLQTLLAIAGCNDIDFIPKPGGDDGYSYGAYDEIIRQARDQKNNSPLVDTINELKTRSSGF